MKSLQSWLDEYALNHQNPTNTIIHKVCVPLIQWSLLAMLWTVNFSAEWPVFNLAVVASVLAISFYATLSFYYAIWMSLITTLMLVSFYFWPGPLFPVGLIVFVLAWIGQFLGHKIEGKKPSFFKDLSFLLIGPLWVLEYFLRRFSRDERPADGKGFPT